MNFVEASTFVRDAEIGIQEKRTAELGTAEHGTAKNGTVEIGTAEHGTERKHGQKPTHAFGCQDR